MNLFTRQKQTHSLRQIYGYQKGKVGGKGQIGNLGLTYIYIYIHIQIYGINWEFGIDTYAYKYISTFKIDNQQRPTVQHRELCSIFCNNLKVKKI